MMQEAVPRLRRPRWLYRLHAFLFGYFWLPCDVCGRPFSGWEWGNDGHTVYESLEWNGTTGFQRGHGVCSARCATWNISTVKGELLDVWLVPPWIIAAGLTGDVATDLRIRGYLGPDDGAA